MKCRENGRLEFKRLSTNSVSVDFRVLLNRFLILFLGVILTCVYNPQKKNQKAVKIIPKIDETSIRRQSLKKQKIISTPQDLLAIVVLSQTKAEDVSSLGSQMNFLEK